MQVLKSLKDLEKDGLGLLLWQSFRFLHVIVKVPVRTVFQTEHDIVLGFESIVQVDQIFMFDRKQNAFLIF
jgi:hypothetical protein